MRYICIHGHFYQPPRENAWLEEVEVQDSAYPFHDWNERITTECYAPNSVSRILGTQREIINLVNNYASMSFNFGPTLLSWLERHNPQTYEAVLEGDRLSQIRFSGHGAALAQVYNHVIMPLASSRDKRTQILWGIADFVHRFKRQPEGMWLAETAVDLETLDIMAEFGVQFTILAPSQANRIRKIGEEQWHDVQNARIDPRRAYRCLLPSGRTIALFFYDGAISQEIAFTGLLDNGERMAERLLTGFSDTEETQLVHIATDGESYGHHHRDGDMTLAYCLYHIDHKSDVSLTIYGEFLERFPPCYDVEIFENSSWSCCHGVERWRNDCGCNSGLHPEWNQLWRAPLRGALDWLRDNLTTIYEKQAGRFLEDIWIARDRYIELILDRKLAAKVLFVQKHASSPPGTKDVITIIKLLEMQRYGLLMYTSCGWFFDEVSGIETMQIISYAARAIQLAKEVGGIDLGETFKHLLKRTPSNLPELGNASVAYTRFVEPAILNLVRVGAHFAVSSLFETYDDATTLFCYSVEKKSFAVEQIGKLRLAVGQAVVRSEVTTEEDLISFAVLHFGDHNVLSGVRNGIGFTQFLPAADELREVFLHSDVAGTISLLESHFSLGSTYSLWHLFRDEQRKILKQLTDSTIAEVEGSLKQLRYNHLPIIDVMHNMHIPLPKLLARTAELVYDADLLRILGSSEPDCDALQKLISDAKRLSLSFDKETAAFLVGEIVVTKMVAFEMDCENTPLLESIVHFMDTIASLELTVNLWKVQNIYFSVGTAQYLEQMKRVNTGDLIALRWTDAFLSLGSRLNVRIA